jgi:hypothetical protein
MESSTITPAATETDFKPVVFASGASNYSVTRTPPRRHQIGETNEFETTPARRYEFVNGTYVAKTQDDVDWLRGYESFGTYYWEPESANAPRAADSSGLQAEIIKAALAGDRDTIADVLVAERSGESRPAVLVACEAALTQMGQALPPKPDTPFHELDRVRMGPTAGVTPGVSPDPVAGSPTVDPATLQPETPAVTTAPANQPAASVTTPGAEGPEANAPQSSGAEGAEPAPSPTVETPGDDQGAPGAPAPSSEGTPPPEGQA